MRKTTVAATKVTIKDIITYLQLEERKAEDLMKDIKTHHATNPSMQSMYYRAEGKKDLASTLLMTIKTNSPHYLKIGI